MAVLIGDHETVDYDDDVLLFDVDEDLHRLQEEMAPLSRLTNEATPSSDSIADKPEFKWFESDLLSPSMSNNGGATSGDTDIDVQGGEADQVHENHLIYVTTTDEVMRVTAVDRATDTITVERGIGGGAASITDGDTLIVFGPAEKEGADAPERLARDRSKENNFVQIFRNSFGVTNTTASTILESGDPEFDRQSRDKSMEHARAKEFAYLFGRKNEDTSGGDVRRMTGGALEFIQTNTLNAGGTLTESNLNSIARSVFQYGSNEKWLLAGGNIIDSINSFAKDNIDVQPAEDGEFGFQVTRYISNYGVINIAYHNLLSRYDRNDLGFMFDLQSIGKKVMDTERDSTLRMNIQNRGKDSTEAEYLSEAGFKLMNEQKCGIITNA